MRRNIGLPIWLLSLSLNVSALTEPHIFPSDIFQQMQRHSIDYQLPIAVNIQHRLVVVARVVNKHGCPG
jgi:hypothetical protein